MQKLYNHQAEYLASHVDAEYFALFWDMGAGKTRAILETARELHARDLVDTLVIIAPNGVHINWTRRQVPIWLDDVEHACLTWDGKHTSKKWRTAVADWVSSDKLKILTMNVEALSYKGGAGTKFIDQIASKMGHRAVLVIDEASTIKSPKANRSKVIVRVAPKFKYRRILTGTPITQSPFDIWMQGEVLKKNMWKRNYYMFRQHHGQFRIKRMGSRSFEELVSYRHLDEIREHMATWGSEVIKSECLDLPPKIYKIVDVPLTDEQVKAYKQMRDYYAAEVKNELVTADSALTKLTKLHQIACGHLIDEDSVSHPIKHNRLSVLDSELAEISGKIIIFSKFIAPIHELMDHLGDRAVEYSGRIVEDEREEAVDRFQTDPDVDIIVISLQSSGAYGLDLFAAGTVIYYSNGYSLERRMQSEDRAHRPGQLSDKVVYIDMVAPGTVDEAVQQALTDKIDVASQVTGLMTSWLR